MDKTEQRKKRMGLLIRVFDLAKPYKPVLAACLLLTLVLAAMAVLRPKLLQSMVDKYVTKGDVDGMTSMAALVFGLLLAEAALRYFFLYHANWIGQSVIRDLRTRVFDHIIRLRLRYFDQTPIGQSTTRTINDIEAINTVFTEGSVTILADLLTLAAVLIVMFATSWKLTLVVISIFPLLIWSSYQFKEAVRKSYEAVRNQVAAMNSFLQEHISGMRIVQIFNAEAREAEKFRRINRDYTAANLKAVLAYAIFFPAVDIMSAMSLGLMVWYGARGVLTEEVTLGVLVVFPLYISMLYRPIRMLADRFNTLQMGLIAAERVFKLLETETPPRQSGEYAPDRLVGEVRFDDVTFSYTDQMEDAALHNISFRIAPGQTLAIVGSTGSGKSTIISLINRLYDIRQGSIQIDSRDIRDYQLSALRRRIAVVLQDVFLFSGSVLDNITLRNEAISRERAIEAARMVGAHDFIMALPGQYDFQVMERGATLSMGQRQLISFARALAFDPDILILDEATSSIDPESEALIQHAIETLIKRRTSIIVAHRLSTIRHANHVLVLEKGRVVEYGNHEQLLASPVGKYRELYEKQFADAAQEAADA